MNQSEFHIFEHPTEIDDDSEASYSNLSSLTSTSSCDGGAFLSSNGLDIIQLRNDLNGLAIKVEEGNENFGKILNYCIFQVPDNVDETKKVLRIAQDLRLGTFVVQCIEMLEKNLNPENCIDIYSFGCDKFLDALKESAFKFILNNFTVVYKEKDFTKLDDISTVKSILGSDRLNVDHEEIVFRAMMDWIKVDLNKRRQHVDSLITLLRLPLCDVRFLTTLGEHFLLYQHKDFHEDVKAVIEGLKEGSEEMTKKIQSLKRKPKL